MDTTDIDDFAKGLEAVFQGKATILNRMRLSCTFYDKERKKMGSADDEWQVMNEIALHRGSSPHLNTIDIYVDGQHLTEAVVRTNHFQASRFTDGRSLTV